jgi:hypothetical protein
MSKEDSSSLFQCRAAAGLKQRTKRRNCPASRREAKAGGSKACFFEKKQQETFGRFDFGAAGDAQPGGSNAFRLFFSTKHRFLPLAVASADLLRPTGAVTRRVLSIGDAPATKAWCDA